VTTSTIPMAAKGKEIVRHGPSALCVINMGAPRDRLGDTTIPSHHAAKKVVVDCVGLYMVVIRIGDAAEYSHFSLGDPNL
jgi:hypothetical protein